MPADIELAYVVRVKVWEDTPKVRDQIEARLERICGLNFHGVEVEDANSIDGDI